MLNLLIDLDHRSNRSEFITAQDNVSQKGGVSVS